MMNKLQISLGNLIALMTLLGALIGSYVSTTERLAIIEAKTINLEKQQTNSIESTRALNSTVSDLRVVVERLATILNNNHKK